MTPEDINWIVKQADRRGYETPDAFMSIKPREGTNHKEYGVMNEGNFFRCCIAAYVRDRSIQ